jgi:hypothetical protein
MSQTIPRYKLAARFLAWTGLIAIIVFTVVPASIRPVTGLGSNFEHLLIFFAVFGAFNIGYELSAARLMLFALLFCGGIELIQIPLPTRHARLSDFVIDFVTSSLAIGITSIIKRLCWADWKNRARGGEN